MIRLTRITLMLFLFSLNTMAEKSVCEVDVHRDLVLLDLEKFQELTFCIYHPLEEGIYPVILISHERGGTQHSNESFARYWSRHGYICIVPSHRDPEEIDIEDHGEEEKGPPSLAIRSLQHRTEDIRFILDSLSDIESSSLPENIRLDPERIGLAGIEWGAHAAQLMGGAILTDSKSQVPTSCPDKRIRAFLMLDPPIDRNLFHQYNASWDYFHRPLMLVLKSWKYSNDSIAELKSPFMNSPPGNKSLVWVESVADQPEVAAKKSQKVPAFAPLSFRDVRTSKPDLSFDVISESTLKFWEIYLKENAGEMPFPKKLKTPSNRGIQARIQLRR